MNKFLKVTIIITTITCSTILMAQTAAESKTFERKIIVEAENGRSMEITQVLKPNPDGTDTIVALKPEKEVKAFYDQLCQDQFGPGWIYEGLGTDTRISKGAIHTYSCHIEGDFPIEILNTY